jgi:hypothetical protein
MGAVLIGSAKGSPGATTTVCALAARWPEHREPFIFEADPTGGDLVVRLASLDGDTGGLRETPSTVQLAAATRHGLHPTTLVQYAQRLPGIGEIRAVVSPASAFASSTAVTELIGANLAGILAADTGFDILVDVGTISATSPTLQLVRGFRHIVLVARSTLESILHTRDLVAALHATGVRSELIVVGDRPYSPLDVADGVRTDVVGVLPFDPIGAAAIAGDARNPKILGRSRLVRASEQAAHDIAHRIPESASRSDVA